MGGGQKYRSMFKNQNVNIICGPRVLDPLAATYLVPMSYLLWVGERLCGVLTVPAKDLIPIALIGVSCFSRKSQHPSITQCSCIREAAESRPCTLSIVTEERLGNRVPL